jgi:hypothetical protein
MGQEKQSSLETRRLERTATQCEHVLTQSLTSEVQRGQMNRERMRLRVLNVPKCPYKGDPWYALKMSWRSDVGTMIRMRES